MPNVYQGEAQGEKYEPHAGSSSMGRGLGKKKSSSSGSGSSSAGSSGSTQSKDSYKNYPSGPRVLVNAAPGGARRGGGMLVSGVRFGAGSVQGENFYDTQGTNYKYHTIFALSVAFVIVFATQLYVKTGTGSTTSEKTGNNIRDSLNGTSGAASLRAWAVLAFVLVSAASFKTTESLAAAFSWLILVSVVLLNGQQLLKMLGNTTPAGTSNVKPTPGHNTNPVKL